MLIYLATPDLSVVKKLVQKFQYLKPNIVLSFGNHNKDKYELLDTDRVLIGKVMLDSGTWTLDQDRQKFQKKINIHNYQTHLNNFSKMFDYYISFDESYNKKPPDYDKKKHVNYDKKKSFKINRAHQEKLEAAGFNPLYVIHSKSDKEINYCVDNNYKYVAVGSQALKEKSKTAKIVNKLYEKGIMTHLCGMTKYNYLKDIPVYSCDSSSWTQAATKSNAIFFWNDQENKPDKIHFPVERDSRTRGKYSYFDYPFKKELNKYLNDDLGISNNDLLGKKGNFNRRMVNMHFFIELERRLTAKHKALGFPY